jgi:hypothetical protein
LISRQGNKPIVKEINLTDNDKIFSVIQKRKDFETVFKKKKLNLKFYKQNERNVSKNITSELHKQSLETAAKENNYNDMFDNTQIL